MYPRINRLQVSDHEDTSAPHQCIRDQFEVHAGWSTLTSIHRLFSVEHYQRLRSVEISGQVCYQSF